MTQFYVGKYAKAAATGLGALQYALKIFRTNGSGTHRGVHAVPGFGARSGETIQLLERNEG
eukprot:CAMPEP_0194058910 /NCGR_PEP_ID=MMETSP0009_2-20130614/67610_1 /TAXON_ID=210454 /ORGANISM="Grammatophora oceanica, Strain CCMP 410" /LENGTH=60 /DNA_ID=CAMNT_0038709233 /DNA_START=26 /DNA_END=208 /DNA_ORIENTATION=+